MGVREARKAWEEGASRQLRFAPGGQPCWGFPVCRDRRNPPPYPRPVVADNPLDDVIHQQPTVALLEQVSGRTVRRERLNSTLRP